MPLYKRPDSPYWWCSIGETVRESTRVRHEGRKKPSEKALEYERTRSEQHWREQRLGERRPVSFREAAAAWLSSDAKARTRDRECLGWLMDKPAPEAPNLGAYAVTDVAGAQVLEAVRKLALQKGWVHSTVDRHMATVSAVLHYAYRPMKALAEPPDVPMYRPVVDEPGYFTRAEFAALMAELPYHLQLAAAFAVATLLRMRAMLSLRKIDIDLAGRKAFVRKRNQKGQLATFAFPLSTDAVGIVERLLELNPGGKWLFQWNGRRLDDCNSTSYQRALKRAGLEWANWHTLRHTGATWARDTGAQDGTLMDLGGWSDIRMVRRYAHHGPLPAHVHAASEAIAGGALVSLVGRPAPGMPSPAGARRGNRPPQGGGGAGRDRTGGLDIANVALSQLSYSPDSETQTFHVAGEGDALKGAETPLPINVLAFTPADETAALRRLRHIKKSKG